MVILPDCSAPQPPFATRPAYIYSCANAAALGLMIADPVDLARGRATDRLARVHKPTDCRFTQVEYLVAERSGDAKVEGNLSA